MTYDLNGTWQAQNGHNAPLFHDKEATVPWADALNVHAAVTGHLNAGVPNDKLIVGMRFTATDGRGVIRPIMGSIHNVPVLPTKEHGQMQHLTIKI